VVIAPPIRNIMLRTADLGAVIAHMSADATGSTKLPSLFLTLPTLLLTGQHVIPGRERH
jgi:hypothetical protein